MTERVNHAGSSRRLRVVFSVWGSTGDMMPLAAVGGALRRHGHEVFLVANPYFAEAATSAGLTLVPVGTVADHEALLADENVFGRERQKWEVIYDRHYYPLMPAYYRAVSELAARGVDVIVADEVGAYCVAEARGIPRARVSPSSVRFASHSDPPHPGLMLPPSVRWMARGPRRMALYYHLHYLRRGMRWPRQPRTVAEQHPIAAFRRSVGLSSQPRSDARLVLGLWPDWFSPVQPDWPDGTVAAGFSMHPPPAFGSHDAGDARDRPIIATTGSVAGSQSDFYRAVVEACRALGRGAILVTPHADHIPGDLPAGVTHVTHAPFSEIFGRAALVIHHGGIGTAAYGLAAGVPQIVVPMRGDQFDNGNRLVRLGVAAMVAIDPQRHQPFVETVRKMLTSPRVAAACRRWQARVDPDAGLRVAVEHIEALAR